ncbi:MAG: hypothetical protein ACYCPE_08965 [Metallibacterium sp.]
MERCCARIARGLSATAGMLLLAGCAMAAPDTSHSAHATPAATTSAAALSLRIATRTMTPRSLNLVVHLYARAPLGAVRVSVVATDPRLAISPALCALQALAPPVVHPAQGARFPLPAIPLCSFVLRATTPARYALTLRVRDAAGTDLIAPVHTVVTIPGGSA